MSTNSVGQVSSDTIHIEVSTVDYRDAGRWGQWSGGGGSSMELVDPRADPLRASSWADSDETAKGEWQQFTLTDTLRFSTQPASRLQLGMLGAGECLLDQLEVLNAAGTLIVTNGGFEVGSGTAANGWSFLGHHRRSRIESTGAFEGSRVLRVIAPGDLDAGRNCIRAPMSGGLNDGSRMTLRVRARWQAGWPEVLFRTRGGGFEMTARLQVPRNLGTPGLPNSRKVNNAGPSIDLVRHTPAVPAAGQPVVVTARVSDPDGVSSVSLRFRTVETAAFSSVAMRDDGAGGDALAGDGIWSGTLNGRGAGELVQFIVEAFDNASSTASSIFPTGTVYAGLPAVSGANVRWGDPVPTGTFNHVHAWLTSSQNTWLSNGQDSSLVGGLDNTFRDCTLVHGNLRVIYNAGIRRKGSPFTGQADYALTVPGDDLLLGTRDRVYGLTGNGGEEATRMRNQIANWIARKMGLPYLNTAYMRFYRNGSPFGSVSEDLEQPSNDYAEAWYPEGGSGDLRKVAFAFESMIPEGLRRRVLIWASTGIPMASTISRGTATTGRGARRALPPTTSPTSSRWSPRPTIAPRTSSRICSTSPTSINGCEPSPSMGAWGTGTRGERAIPRTSTFISSREVAGESCPGTWTGFWELETRPIDVSLEAMMPQST